MKTIEINAAGYEQIKKNPTHFFGLLYFPLESQPYGLVENHRWRFCVSDDSASLFVNLTGGAIIPDSGRTKGFFQNTGATGVLEKNALLDIFNERECRIVAQLPDAEIGIEGDTWQAIVNQLPAELFGWAQESAQEKKAVIDDEPQTQEQVVTSEVSEAEEKDEGKAKKHFGKKKR